MEDDDADEQIVPDEVALEVGENEEDPVSVFEIVPLLEIDGDVVAVAVPDDDCVPDGLGVEDRDFNPVTVAVDDVESVSTGDTVPDHV